MFVAGAPLAALGQDIVVQSPLGFGNKRDDAGGSIVANGPIPTQIAPAASVTVPAGTPNLAVPAPVLQKDDGLKGDLDNGGLPGDLTGSGLKGDLNENVK